MRTALFLLCVMALAGCGGSPENKIPGTWHVDPSSVQTSRLPKTLEKNPDWTDATTMLGKVSVTFGANPKTVTATGFGLKSDGTWSLHANAIEVSGAGDHWPAMAFDPNTNRIHLTLSKEGEDLHMDLTRG